MTMTIAIDHREKSPYRFDTVSTEGPIPTVVSSLTTGDYALYGYEDRFVIERKTIDDLFGTLGTAARRKRFEAELDRMASMYTLGHQSKVIVEATPQQIMSYRSFLSKTKGVAIMKHVNKFIYKYTSVHWSFFSCKMKAELHAFNSIVSVYKTVKSMERMVEYSLNIKGKP